jgi:transposase-like protein
MEVLSIMRTKEEKLKLIEEYKASGLTMNKWCVANGIATSTMSTWIAKTNNKKRLLKHSLNKIYWFSSHFNPCWFETTV